MERQYEPEFTTIQPVFVPNPVPPSSRLIMELKTPIIYGKKFYFIKLIIDIFLCSSEKPEQPEISMSHRL